MRDSQWVVYFAYRQGFSDGFRRTGHDHAYHKHPTKKVRRYYQMGYDKGSSAHLCPDIYYRLIPGDDLPHAKRPRSSLEEQYLIDGCWRE